MLLLLLRHRLENLLRRPDDFLVVDVVIVVVVIVVNVVMVKRGHVACRCRACRRHGRRRRCRHRRSRVVKRRRVVVVSFDFDLAERWQLGGRCQRLGDHLGIILHH